MEMLHAAFSGHLSDYEFDYDEAFGFEADLHPRNIIDNKHFQIKTPDVVIKVDPARSDLIETRIIGGVKYIMICADEDVEVNGVSITIKDEEKETAPADSKKKNVFLKAKDFAVRKADALGKNVQKVATAASKASQDVFRNKSLVKRQMLFYGAVKLCESDLDDFMLS